jgi:hypothetical protein
MAETVGPIPERQALRKVEVCARGGGHDGLALRRGEVRVDEQRERERQACTAARSARRPGPRCSAHAPEARPDATRPTAHRRRRSMLEMQRRGQAASGRWRRCVARRRLEAGCRRSRGSRPRHGGIRQRAHPRPAPLCQPGASSDAPRGPPAHGPWLRTADMLTPLSSACSHPQAIRLMLWSTAPHGPAHKAAARVRFRHGAASSAGLFSQGYPSHPCSVHAVDFLHASLSAAHAITLSCRGPSWRGS